MPLDRIFMSLNHSSLLLDRTGYMSLDRIFMLLDRAFMPLDRT